VVRTTLTSTVQVGGSIGFAGSYVVVAPTGPSAEQVAQDEQQLTQAQEGLANDEAMNGFGATQDQNALSAAQNGLAAAQAALAADEARLAAACAGRGASSPGCAQDGAKVAQDQGQVDQANQQLAAAELGQARDGQQAQAKIEQDDNQIASAQAGLAQAEASEVGSGTTYTGLPKVGDLIRQDQPVYWVSNQPVPLLYGSVTAYRAFRVGMADGADVGQLTRDLISLGFGAGLTQSDHFSAATAAALERWQTALGVPATGVLLLGQAVFEPGPIRVTSVTPSVGQAVGGGTVIDATSTSPIVTVNLDVTQEYLLKPGDAVSVELPDGVTTVGGHVVTVGNVAVCPGSGNGNGAGTGTGSNNSADQTPCTSSGSGSSSTPTVTVTVALDSTPPGATLDQAPVNVNITTDRAQNVLAVPVNALLALQGGGFGVEVIDGNTTRLVGVTTGLYSNTLVQISGAGITAGTKVEVPSS
jgi:multidrug efflux pump subunit AcrA (membrane-fusion protein)